MKQSELDLQFELVELPEELSSILQRLHEEGYRYVVQDKDMNSVACFSIEPKKYNDPESWGYSNPDAPGALPAYPILGARIPDVRWANRSATLIKAYLGVRE